MLIEITKQTNKLTTLSLQKSKNSNKMLKYFDDSYSCYEEQLFSTLGKLLYLMKMNN